MRPQPRKDLRINCTGGPCKSVDSLVDLTGSDCCVSRSVSEELGKEGRVRLLSDFSSVRVLVFYFSASGRALPKRMPLDDGPRQKGPVPTFPDGEEKDEPLIG